MGAGLSTSEIFVGNSGVTISASANFLQHVATAQTVLLHITSTSSLAGVWEGTFDPIDSSNTESAADWFPLPSLIVNTSGATLNDPGATITPTDDDILAAATMGAKWCRYRRTAGSGTANYSLSNAFLSEITESAVSVVVTGGGGSARDQSVVKDDTAFTAGSSWIQTTGFLADETSTDSVDEGDTGAARMTLNRKQIQASDALVSTNQYLSASGPVLREVAVTFSMAAEAHSAGDVLADSQIIATCVRANDAKGYLVGFQLLDEDDNAAAQIDVVFLSANVTIGTEGSAVSVSDANARNILGIVSVPSTAWCDLINSKLATMTMSNPMAAGLGGLPLPIVPVSGTDDIYVALIARGTPTPTASGMTGRFYFADGL